MKNRYEFDKKTREDIYERDGFRCIYCNSARALGVAHIFISRAHGGLGVKENGALLCQRCHHDLDNGINGELAEAIKNYTQSYIKKHHQVSEEKIKFKKFKGYKYGG